MFTTCNSCNGSTTKCITGTRGIQPVCINRFNVYFMIANINGCTFWTFGYKKNFASGCFNVFCIGKNQVSFFFIHKKKINTLNDCTYFFKIVFDQGHSSAGGNDFCISITTGVNKMTLSGRVTQRCYMDKIEF